LFSVLATASSVYNNNVDNYGPQYAIDGLISEGTTIGDTKIYHSEHEVQPWFQIKFVKATEVKGVTFTNRKDGSGERFQNVAIHVGDQPAVIGGRRCPFFEKSFFEKFEKQYSIFQKISKNFEKNSTTQFLLF
jgi:hypothetical protein